MADKESDKEVEEFKQKFVKLKELHTELLKAFDEAKNYTGKTDSDSKVFEKIESILDQIAALTAPAKK